MYILDICDIIFFIKSLKFPTNVLNITNYVSNLLQVILDLHGSSNKLQHLRTTNVSNSNFYFSRFPIEYGMPYQ